MKNVLKKFGLSFLALVFVLSVGIFADTKTAFAAGPAMVNLNSAGNYLILSKTLISTTGVTSIVGDIGISPAAASYIHGFGLVLDSTGCFSKTVPTTLVTGRVYAADYNTQLCTTPDTLTTAVSAMEAAYTDAATRTPGTGATNLNVGGGTLTGLNFVPGTYTWGSNVTITGDITFTGSATDVWIIQISGNLSIDSGKKILLGGSAQASNIFWAVAGTTTLGTTSIFEGNILAGPDASTIAMQDGATLHGRALGQKDVTLIGSTISAPVASSNGSRAHSSSGSIPKNFPNTTTAPGCSAGNVFNTSTGATCVNNAVVETSLGCSGGNLFNTSTGATCVNNEVVETSLGCSGGNLFNISTGKSCSNNTEVTSKKVYALGQMTLKNGSKGEAVKELQRFLNDKLSLGLVIDGSLGPKTIAVIKKWQKDNGLLDDGLVGVKTKALMNSK